jgi:hypothetical protein
VNTAKIQIGFPLESLPNQEGFRFRGIERNGDLLACKVEKDSNGLHFVTDETTGERCFYRLRGWMQYTPQTYKRS